MYKVALSPGMADARVSSRVNMALAAVQPMVNNYFWGVLQGLISCLSLTVPPGEESAHSTHMSSNIWLWLFKNVHLQLLLRRASINMGYI